jgi:hypothetical protein
MNSAEQFFQIISITAFLIYGPLCIFSEKTILEFKRYGFPHFRKLVGSLEIAGAVGLILGFYSMTFLLLSSAGLALLMFCGVVVRLRIKDKLIFIVPAFVLFILNLFIFFKALNSY